MSLNVWLSALPVLLLIILMMLCKVKSHWSALTALAVAVIVALICSGFTTVSSTEIPFSMIRIVGESLAEGIIKALFPILGVIIMALFSYNILLASGDIEIIKSHLASLGSHRGLLVLLLTWGFGGLLEGIAGFGTAVAIPTAILVGLGFNPLFSAVVSLIANTVFTDFGAVGITMYTLVAEFTSQTPSPEVLSIFARAIITQLIPFFFIIPFIILTLTDRRLSWNNLFTAIIIGISGWGVQILCIRFAGYQTPSIVAPLISMGVIVVLSRIYNLTEKSKKRQERVSSHSIRELLRAWSVYICIIIMILLTGGTIPAIETFLHSHLFSEVYFTSTGASMRLLWLGNATLWIFVGSVIGGLVQNLSVSEIAVIFCRTLYSIRWSAMTIICLICMANIMGHTGMTATLAVGIVSCAGNSYPLFAPVVGALGTFITGSNTSSQILFGKLQANAALALELNDMSALQVGASNLTGGSAGKMLSPQSIAVASAACNLTGKDDVIMRRTLPYALGYLILLSLTVYYFC